MVMASLLHDLVRGSADPELIRGLVYARHEQAVNIHEHMSHRLKKLEGTWLATTLKQAPTRSEYPNGLTAETLPWYKRPGIWACTYLEVISYVLFVVLR